MNSNENLAGSPSNIYPASLSRFTATRLQALRRLGVWMAALCLGAMGNAYAAEFVVNTAGFDGVDVDPGNGVCSSGVGCTLRAAVMEANANNNPDETDTIIIGSSIVNISLSIQGFDDASEGDLDITEDVEIIADRLNNTAVTDIKDRLTTIDATAMNNRIFHIQNGANMLLRGLRLTGGGVNPGGAIWVDDSTLTIEHSVLQSNHPPGNGGAIFVGFGSDAILNLDNVDIADNTVVDGSSGAGIYNAGITLIRHSSIRNNVAANAAQILNNNFLGGALTIENSTITGSNNAPFGITSMENSTLVMDGVTVANHTNTGVYIEGTPASLSISRTAFHDNAVDCVTPAVFFVAIFNYNWFEEMNSDCSVGIGNQQGTLVTGMMGDLTALTTNNHTVTYYYAIPDVGSALLEQGGTVEQGCALTTDQRGEPRPYNGNNVGVNACDIGAIEFNTRFFADGFESL